VGGRCSCPTLARRCMTAARACMRSTGCCCRARATCAVKARRPRAATQKIIVRASTLFKRSTPSSGCCTSGSTRPAYNRKRNEQDAASERRAIIVVRRKRGNQKTKKATKFSYIRVSNPPVAELTKLNESLLAFHSISPLFI
jgi:hypothetical protein